MTFDPTDVRLGKHLGVVEDPRTLKLGAFLVDRQLPPTPKAVAVTHKVKSWPMFANDVHGDCTCASTGHGLLARSTREGHPIELTDADVLDLYGRVNGGKDEGAYMLDVLNELRHNGIAGHKIGAFAKLDADRWDHVLIAMKYFGGVYAGVALPNRAQSQIGRVWSIKGDAKTGLDKPGSWGGHAIELLWGTSDHATCVTWGQKQRMTRTWLQHYSDELYVVLSPEWLGDDQKSPQGFDLQALTEDLAAL